MSRNHSKEEVNLKNLITIRNLISLYFPYCFLCSYKYFECCGRVYLLMPFLQQLSSLVECNYDFQSNQLGTTLGNRRILDQSTAPYPANNGEQKQAYQGHAHNFSITYIKVIFYIILENEFKKLKVFFSVNSLLVTLFLADIVFFVIRKKLIYMIFIYN